MTPAERQTLVDAHAALLSAMVAAAKAAVAISALIIADGAPDKTEDRVARGLMFNVPAEPDRTKPGPPPKERS